MLLFGKGQKKQLTARSARAINCRIGIVSDVTIRVKHLTGAFLNQGELPVVGASLDGKRTIL
jgi:hypothetical protein